jgi:hypothetical protein
VGGKDPLVLPNANSKFRRQTPPAANAVKNQCMFQARSLEREDSIGGPNGPFERRMADFRRGAMPSASLCGLHEYPVERLAAERDFDPDGVAEHFNQRLYESHASSAYQQTTAPPSSDADAR